MHARFRPATRIVRRALAGCLVLSAAGLAARAAEEPPHSAELDRMIIDQAKRNGVPEKLVRRIVMRESKYDPRARNHLYWGLMQISYPTARSMGFKGTPEQLLNPLVNLTYAVPYLANAFVIAGKREDEAVRLYAAGYYFTARQRGLLGVLRTAASAPLHGMAPNAIDDSQVVASAAPVPAPAPNYGIFGALVSPDPQPQPQQVASLSPAGALAGEAPTDAAVEPHAASAMDKAAAATAVSMVPDRSGNMAPPKKWLHDGGMTEIARGEQGIETDAAYVAANEPERVQKSAHHSRKTTTFAALDPAAPSSAQAYASADSQAFAQSAPQAAITQATAFSPQPIRGAAPQQALAQAGPSQADPNQVSPSVEVTEKPRHKVARKAHRKGLDDGATEVAQSDVTKSDTIKADDKKSSGDRKRVHHVKKSSDTPVVASGQPNDGASVTR